MSAKYLLGIDLGTTNCVLSYVELDAEGRIVVDRARRYEFGRWKEAGSFLPV